MGIKIINYLSEIAAQNGMNVNSLQFPNCEIKPEKIKVIMISEVPSQDPEDGFYSINPDSDYMTTTKGLFEGANVSVNNMNDILNMGIYITTAIKCLKTGYTVDTAVIKDHLPFLEAEISLFPNLKVIMLMGDVAKKAVNLIGKSKTKKNIIPSESTYKIRQNEYYFDDVRVIPSYIMTGKNLLIEKSKSGMISEDIRHMMEVIN